MTRPVFLYGTLCDPDLYEIVSGTAFNAVPASLPDVAIHWVAGEAFPIPVQQSGSTAQGVLVTPDDSARARLDFYELGFGYDVEERQVLTPDGPVTASVYVPEKEWSVGAAWSLSDWQNAHGPLTQLAAEEYMGLMATHAPEDAARAFPQVRMRAASRLRAMSDTAPEVFLPKMSGKPIHSEKHAQPYTDYFAVREDWLSFPTFDGGQSEIVKRASFMGGDAVTILPFDPATGEVLVIRQFRHGAYARGDTNPWTLEPAAGRIDPGEAPEETARRELLEETGVEARELHLVGRYYPSPGAYSEYLYSYVAIADLTGTDGGIAGLDDEAEDILRHTLPLDDALQMIESGAANTGPLILSLGWLALNRDRFR